MTTGLRHIATEPANLNQKPFTAMDRKRSPQLRNKMKSVAGTASDSDGSVESNSLSVDSNNDQVSKIPPSKEPVLKRINRRGSEWEIVEGLKDGQRFEKKPEVFTGYLHKKRKWPLKGWHKRYFVLDKGILVYGKSPGDVARGKIHGSVDIGLSVISTKSKRKRLDIDAEEFIHHLKAKQYEVFQQWVQQLKQHRLYRQHLLTYGTRDAILSDDNKNTPNNVHRTKLSPEVGREVPRLAAWLLEANPPLDMAARDLTQAQQSLAQLARLVEQLETSSQADTELFRVPLTRNFNSFRAEAWHRVSGGFRTTKRKMSASDGLSPNVKKDRRKFGLRKKKSGKGSSVDLNAGSSPNKTTVENESSSPLSTCSCSGGLSISAVGAVLSSSNPSLTTAGVGVTRPQSLPAGDHLFPPLPPTTGLPAMQAPDNQLHSDYLVLAKELHSSLKSVLYTLSTERERLKSALEAEGSAGNSGVIATLRNTLHQTIQQNSELRARLNRIHESSDLSDLSETVYDCFQKPLHQSLSYSSSCLSASEFFDAESGEGEGAGGEGRGGGGGGSDTSSEAGSLTSEEGSVSSENSEMGGSEYNPMQPLDVCNSGANMTGRRTKLPATRPNTEGLSLWNLLCKNIGKDLSQVSMPVALNEPLNMLQRLCEELEYSELLDKASEMSDPYDRMVYVAAFAVSSYGSSYFRAGSKPFNPLLGETYECIREDKGFRFVAEQVSHHPPVSVCYAESRNFIFWQDARIKTKFWGKSMEFQPTGYVHVKLMRPGGEGYDLYKYNKVTTCVHNLFNAQRWVDQYGELKITSGKITCKLTFVKASYWSAKRHEIHGSVVDEDEGKVVRNLFGKWSEALYCGVAPTAKCVWRPGAMPEDYELYYGFTRFAMELNELNPDHAKYLPNTDTRFRPDQRLLEEGNLNGAEAMKLQLEQAQRERRKSYEQSGAAHEPRWFTSCPYRELEMLDEKSATDNGEETWEFNHKYWEVRKSPGFVNMNIEPLW
ncbi:oxysterol-binding protein-related protein 3-like isoform X2 [Macrosteles quadrilineatus]|uniref:oxysterol-binding protein-related protein 3-like isoform X2 n=1 Tax=Macrosteles quadrilineatus TaxID=74068 RepID=UPI0023E0C968|nr:oxysterol-binding protein-related protein 3-like isoform X2 [Macrosteles quadrilineatus]